jgi:hypothetical protein
VFLFSALEILALNIMEPILLAGRTFKTAVFLEEKKPSPKWNSLRYGKISR